MFRNNRLIGVASYWDRGAGRMSGHADLTHPSNVEFMTNVAQQHNINIAGLNWEQLPGGNLGGDSRKIFLAVAGARESQVQLVASTSKQTASVAICRLTNEATLCNRENALLLSTSASEKGSRKVFTFSAPVTAEDRLQIVTIDANQGITSKREFTIKPR